MEVGYVVIAEFKTVNGSTDTFLTRMRRHAELSRSEPGCHVFDVCQDASDPATVILYEVYADEAAYKAHQAMPYYAAFREWAPPLLVPRDGSLFQTRRVLSRIA
jgi:autoinducer 2-degrading protein